MSHLEHAYAQKLEEDIIPVLPWDTMTQLFANPNHVPPQDVIAMRLGQGVVDPNIFVEVLDVRSVVQHPNGNLEFPSKSADKLHRKSERKDLIVVRVRVQTPTDMADAVLAFVFSGNPGPAWDHEHCAGRQNLATKDRIAMVKLVTNEWDGHGCRRRVVERIVGKQVERLIGGADDSAIERSNLL